MKQSIKHTLRDWLPPALIRWLIKAKGIGNRFEGDYSCWKDAQEKCSGYDSEKILNKVLDASIKVKNGHARYERDSVVFDHVEYSWPVTAALMWAAARNKGRLNVLDFGGSLGSSYFQNKIFLDSLSKVNWSVVEQPHYVDAGKKHIESEQLKFFKTIDECGLNGQYDIILLSSVLQYIDDFVDIIKQLKKLNSSLLVIDRTPFSLLDSDKILIQKVPDSIYSASYPMRVFSRTKFIDLLNRDWKLVSEFVSPEGIIKSTAGLEFEFKGMLLELKYDC